MFFAAITSWTPYASQDEEVGLVIVTTVSDQGLLDVQDRRPVVLAPHDARIWMDNSLPKEQAEQIARVQSLPAEAFEWFRVSPSVNSARNNTPALIEPIDPQD
jgi:putative SOS response-associated peptidase YedK